MEPIAGMVTSPKRRTKEPRAVTNGHQWEPFRRKQRNSSRGSGPDSGKSADDAGRYLHGSTAGRMDRTEG